MPESTRVILGRLIKLFSTRSANRLRFQTFLCIYSLLIVSSSAFAEEQPYILHAGYCEAITTYQNNNETFLGVAIQAINALWEFDYEFRLHDGYSGDELLKQAKVTVLQTPSHGKLKESPLHDWVSYLPAKGYQGLDKIVVLVKFDKYQVKLTGDLHIVNVSLSDDASDFICEKTGRSYPLSTLPHPPPVRFDAIVKKPIDVQTLDKTKPKLKLAVGDIVYYTKENAGKVLLTDLSLIPLGWIPSSSLIRTQAFKPLSQWGGQSRVAYCTDSICEGPGAEYELHKNGTYSLLKQNVSLGRLFRYQDYLWARTTDSKVNITSGMLLNLYKIQADGKLWAVLVETGEHSFLMETQENQECPQSSNLVNKP